MKIDGKAIAYEIKKDLIKQVKKLKSRNIFPHLAVILVGNDPASITYVRRKEMLAQEIGAKISIFRLSASTCNDGLLINLAAKLNKEQSIHGIIIQRPVPLPITDEELNNLVVPIKDVDGFHSNSPFNPPVAGAVINILNYVFLMLQNKKLSQKQATAQICDNNKFFKWLKKQKVLIIGRGETAGKPIASTLKKKGIEFKVAHSQTENLKDVCLSSNIIISCVGKADIVRQEYITDKTILIGVGLHPENEKLQTDYIQEGISQKAAFYTPVPGGVGPVNVACLFANLLKAAIIRL